MRIRVGHLYPDYLNIYADRGNIAVLARRAPRRAGTSSTFAPSSIGDRGAAPGEIDLFYIGGGQDREQALVAADLAGKGEALHEAVEGGAAFLAVCGGYQLLGRFYRDRAGAELPGIGLLPLHTVAGERRMIGDVLLDCELGRRARSPASRTTPAARSSTRAPSRSAASSPGSGTTARPATRAAAPAASTARTSTARSCRATAGSPTGARGRARPRDRRRARARAARRTSSRPRRTPSRPARARDARRPEPHLARPRATPRYTAGSPGLPALEEALDRRVDDDLLELVEREEPRAAHRRVAASRRPRASGARGRRRR